MQVGGATHQNCRIRK